MSPSSLICYSTQRDVVKVTVKWVKKFLGVEDINKARHSETYCVAVTLGSSHWNTSAWNRCSNDTFFFFLLSFPQLSRPDHIRPPICPLNLTPTSVHSTRMVNSKMRKISHSSFPKRQKSHPSPTRGRRDRETGTDNGGMARVQFLIRSLTLAF